jgi:hypothetical protein
MLEPGLAREVIAGLRPEAREALLAIGGAGGRHPILDLERRFGAIRPMGPGRRDREKPWRSPASALEDLWYRALVGRAFIETPTGPLEVLFIPTDLTGSLASATPPMPPGARIQPPPRVRAAHYAALEDLTILLASFRRKPPPSEQAAEARLAGLLQFLRQPDSAALLLRLAVDLGLLAGKPLKPDPEPARAFLEKPPPQALASLLASWRESRRWNDLGRLAYIEPPRTGWPNQPDGARAAFLEILDRVPRNEWWSIESLVAWFMEHAAGYQRPGGDFDAWHLRYKGETQFADGFEHWEAIDGELIRSYLRGPLLWLGAIRLAEAGPPGFQLLPLAEVAFGRPAPGLPPPPSEPARLRPDAVIVVPPGCDAAQRYQLARVADLRARTDEGLELVLTPSSVRSAWAQRLTTEQIVALLEAASRGRLPPNLAKAIRQVKPGARPATGPAALTPNVDDEALRLLRAARGTARLLDAPAGRGVRLRPGVGWEAFRAAAARAGVLLEAGW